MYNSQMPSMDELPTSAQLVRSTLIAAVGAAALLVTVVLPSEYAIDPTGIGRALGLTQMGEIKRQLAAEAKAEAAQTSTPSPAIVGTGSATVPVLSVERVAKAERTDRMQVELAPGEGAEVKVTATDGTRIEFDWSVTGGRVNYDTHGDGKPGARLGFYHGYGKGKDVASDRGTLVAAFDGSHGWFWRNRSGAPVTVTINVKGGYTAIKRVA